MNTTINKQILELPKVELHKHLEGSFRLNSLIELAPTLNIEIPTNKKDIQDYFVMDKPMNNLSEVIDKLFNGQQFLVSEEIIERLTYEVCEDAFDQNIKVLELRYAPSFIQLNHNILNFKEIHRAVMRGIHRATKDFPIAIGLIGIIVRSQSIAEAQKSIDFFIDNQQDFLALDLADVEVGFDCKLFAPMFEQAKKAGLRISVHSGEENVQEAPQFVKDAIDYLHAERIGHGLQIFKDQKIMEYVKHKNIHLEICPLSNWFTKAIDSKEQHPIRMLYDFGLSLSINSDDPGIFGTTILHDYQIAYDQYGFTMDEFKNMNLESLKRSFLPENEKEALKKHFL